MPDTGPDFTSGACPRSTTMAYTRNAGITVWCGKARGHEGTHHFWVEWSDGASDVA